MTTPMKTQDIHQNDGFTLAQPPKLLRAGHVAQVLGVSVKTVHKLVREGKLSCVQVTAKERRFMEEQVQEYIRCRTTPVRVDTKPHRPVLSRPKKGGDRSFGDSVRAQLRKEMRSWR